MSNRKVFALCLLSNVLLLAVAAGVFVLAQPALAQGSPSAPNAPSQPQIGPYYAAYSASDFQTWNDGLGSFNTKRSGYALVKDSNFGIAVVGLHLPAGASIISLGNDSAAAPGGHTVVRLKQCPVYNDNCSELTSADQNAQGRHLAVVNVNIALDTQNNAYFLQVDLQDDSGFYNAFVGYTLPSSFLFVPSVAR